MVIGTIEAHDRIDTNIVLQARITFIESLHVQTLLCLGSWQIRSKLANFERHLTMICLQICLQIFGVREQVKMKIKAYVNNNFNYP